MAPRTIQTGASKLPKGPGPGPGPGPGTGSAIPSPSLALPRRKPGTTSPHNPAKTHSPWLDHSSPPPPRKHQLFVLPSPDTQHPHDHDHVFDQHDQDNYQDNHPELDPQLKSPIPSTLPSPKAVLASPLSLRRPSASRPSKSPTGHFEVATSIYSRRPSVSASATSSPSPTTGSGQGRFATTTAESPLGPGTGSSPSTPRLSGAASTVRTGPTKPLSQRPIPGKTLNPLPVIPGSPAQAQGDQTEEADQVEAPASGQGEYRVGDRVAVESMGLSGYLRFLGPTSFKLGIWAGIELDTPTGKNDGSVGGVSYFTCRPRCGIFVLAAKIVKTDLLLSATAKSTLLTANAASASANLNHAAQAASRITAGSRASKYIGLTATQLKQRNGLAQSTTTRPTATTTTAAPGPNKGPLHSPSPPAASASARTQGLGTGTSTFAARSAALAATRARSNSPSISQSTPKSALTSPSVAPRPVLGGRVPHSGNRTPASTTVATKPGHARSTSITSSLASPAATSNGLKSKLSPAAGKIANPTRKLLARAETPDTANIETRSLLDQATLVQLSGNSQDSVSAQLQQLQLDFGVALAENDMLKTEMNQAKSQLETSRLLEKRDLSYDDRVFLSKSLGHVGIEERLAQELEDLHLMKAVWEQERLDKDQEIVELNEKVTQAWLDSSRSQQERIALLQENQELTEKLQEKEARQEREGMHWDGEVNGDGDVEHHTIPPIQTEEAWIKSQEQQALIDSLRISLEESDEKTMELEKKVQVANSRALEGEEKLQDMEHTLASNLAQYTRVNQELEEELQAARIKLSGLGEGPSTAELESKVDALKAHIEESKAQLAETMDQLEYEIDARQQEELDAEAKIHDAENRFRECQTLLEESEDRVNEMQASLSKRDRELASLRLELEALTATDSSAELDQMHQIWEQERKHLEETIEEKQATVTILREEIQTLVASEAKHAAQVKELETTLAAATRTASLAESLVGRLRDEAQDDREHFENDRLEWEQQLAQVNAQLESHLADAESRAASLKSAERDIRKWKEDCYKERHELAQKEAMVHQIETNLEESLAQQEALAQEAAMIRKELEDKISEIMADKERQQQKVHTEVSCLREERELLQATVADLEAAVTLASSVQASRSSSRDPSTTGTEGTDDTEIMSRSDLEDEMDHLKQVVRDLTRDNVAVGNVNKKLMQEHDNLMEAHKHVETECFKLMDEVERLHAENLAATAMEDDLSDVDLVDDLEGEQEDVVREDQQSLDGSTYGSTVGSNNPAKKLNANVSSSASVIRLEVLLKEKQALLDRLTQAHATELRELRQLYVDLDQSRAYEVGQLNKELAELELLVESKIFHEADLEEEVRRQQKRIERLQQEITDMKKRNGRQIPMSPNSPAGPGALPNRSTSLIHHTEFRSSSSASLRSPLSVETLRPRVPERESTPLFCEVCEAEGHDLISCTAVFGTPKRSSAANTSTSGTPVPSGLAPAVKDDAGPYCDNCEEYGSHDTDDCPNESLTY